MRPITNLFRAELNADVTLVQMPRLMNSSVVMTSNART